MKFSKGIINNINRKLIAGSLALTFLTTPLTGCSKVSINDIKYIKNDQGYVQGIEESVSCDTLKYCNFYEVYNQATESRYYTICLRDDFNGTYEVKYYDVFTGQELKYSDYVFSEVETLDDYLDKEKTEYSEKELKEILNKVIEIQKENNKQLVKGK